MMKREGLAMVYVFQKFRQYLLGGNFHMYTDHSMLKYLVNKPVLGGGRSVDGFSYSKNLILRSLSTWLTECQAIPPLPDRKW